MSCKGKGHPLTSHRRNRVVEVYRYLCLTSALDVGGRSKPRPGRFTPGESALCYPLSRKLSGPQGRYRPVWEREHFLTFPESQPRTVENVASRYTDYATMFHVYIVGHINNSIFRSILSESWGIYWKSFLSLNTYTPQVVKRNTCLMKVILQVTEDIMEMKNRKHISTEHGYYSHSHTLTHTHTHTHTHTLPWNMQHEPVADPNRMVRWPA